MPKSISIKPEFDTPPQLAKLWGVSPDKIVYLIRTGELEAVNLAKTRTGRPRYRISKDAQKQFMRSRLVVPDRGLSTTRRLRRKAATGITEYF